MQDKIEKIKDILGKLDCFLNGKDVPIEYRFYIQDIEQLLQLIEYECKSKPMIATDYLEWHKFYIDEQIKRNM